MALVGCTVYGTDTELVCKSAAYCSSACQEKDLALHDLLCKKLPSFLDNTLRPQDAYQTTHRLALLFEKDEDLPEFTWVETTIAIFHDGRYSLACDLEWLGDNAATAVIHTRHDRKIQLWRTRPPRPDINIPICTLIEGGWDFMMEEAADSDDFQDSIVVMGVEDTIMDSIKDDARVTKYRDVTPDNLRVALRCFLAEVDMFDGSNAEDDGKKWVIFGQPDFFKAVMISNQENVAYGEPNFREVMLNKHHRYIDSYDDKSVISERMGITLVTRKCLSYGGTLRDNTNTEAFALLLSAKTSKDNKFWGQIPRKKYDNLAFLLFRKDKEDITKQQVKVLSVYCQDVLRPALKEPADWAWEKEDKEAVLDVWCSTEEFGVHCWPPSPSVFQPATAPSCTSPSQPPTPHQRAKLSWHHRKNFRMQALPSPPIPVLELLSKESSVLPHIELP
ncbi:hypothetical protein BDZ45DRAFT_692007 [Acephala macrosclerotiorum]|nr:hypothetical protein BDZ45DRAFT_692007 [Acephala macrosclerotiorum]